MTLIFYTFSYPLLNQVIERGSRMNKRILIIDDEDDLREVTQMTLEYILGWEVITASSGRAGLTKASLEQPDLILLDVMMPEWDGLMTFQKLQAHPKTQHIPVIFLTAQVKPEEHRKLALYGVSGVITKPFEPLNLGNLLADMLNWS